MHLLDKIFVPSYVLLHFCTDKWYSSMHCFLDNLIQWAWRQHCSNSSFMFASFPALRKNTHMIGVLVLKLLNTISASMSELKRASWEHVLVQVLGRWVGGRQWWPGDVQYIGDTPQVSAYKGHLSPALPVNASLLRSKLSKIEEYRRQLGYHPLPQKI